MASPLGDGFHRRTLDQTGTRSSSRRNLKRTPGGRATPVARQVVMCGGDLCLCAFDHGEGGYGHLRTGEGWLYLATVIDLATRMVVGWQLASHMRTTLVTDALQMAVDSGHVDRDAIFHSDKGYAIYLGRVRRIHRQKRHSPQSWPNRCLLG